MQGFIAKFLLAMNERAIIVETVLISNSSSSMNTYVLGHISKGLLFEWSHFHIFLLLFPLVFLLVLENLHWRNYLTFVSDFSFIWIVEWSLYYLSETTINNYITLSNVTHHCYFSILPNGNYDKSGQYVMLQVMPFLKLNIYRLHVTKQSKRTYNVRIIFSTFKRVQVEKHVRFNDFFIISLQFLFVSITLSQYHLNNSLNDYLAVSL